MEIKAKGNIFRVKLNDIKVKLDEIKQKMPGFISRLNRHSVLAIAGIIGPIVLVVGDMVAAFYDPNYNLIKDSISSLALTNVGWLQTIGFMLLGLLVEVFTTGLLFAVKRAKWFDAGIAIFVFFGFAMLLIGAFHTDPAGVSRTLESRIHGFMATTAFTLFPISLLCLLPSVKRDDNWKIFFQYTRVTIFLAVFFLILNKIFRDGSGFFGLVERLLVLNIILWVEVFAFRLFFLSLKRGDESKLKPAANEDF